MSSHFLLQGICPTRDWTQVSCITGGLFTVWATREAPQNSHLPQKFSVKESICILQSCCLKVRFLGADYNLSPPGPGKPANTTFSFSPESTANCQHLRGSLHTCLVFLLLYLMPTGQNPRIAWLQQPLGLVFESIWTVVNKETTVTWLSPSRAQQRGSKQKHVFPSLSLKEAYLHTLKAAG